MGVSVGVRREAIYTVLFLLKCSFGGLLLAFQVTFTVGPKQTTTYHLVLNSSPHWEATFWEGSVQTLDVWIDSSLSVLETSWSTSVSAVEVPLWVRIVAFSCGTIPPTPTAGKCYEVSGATCSLHSSCFIRPIYQLSTCTDQTQQLHKTLHEELKRPSRSFEAAGYVSINDAAK